MRVHGGAESQYSKLREEQRKPATPAAGGGGAAEDESSEEACYRELLPCPWTLVRLVLLLPRRDLGSMTEEEQIAYAMQMSMADAEKPEESAKAESIDVDEGKEDILKL